MNDTPTYQIGVGPDMLDPKRYSVLVIFESCASLDEAKKMAPQVAELMQRAFGGKLDRVQ